ncbi:hypothetical protein [Chitinimonas naiadis]
MTSLLPVTNLINEINHWSAARGEPRLVGEPVVGTETEFEAVFTLDIDHSMDIDELALWLRQYSVSTYDVTEEEAMA